MPNIICKFLKIGTLQGSAPRKNKGRQLGTLPALLVTEHERFNDVSSYMQISNPDRTTTNYLTVMVLGDRYGSDKMNYLFKARFPTGDPWDFNKERNNGFWLCLTDQMKMHTKGENRKFLVMHSRGLFSIDWNKDRDFSKKVMTFGIYAADVFLVLKKLGQAKDELVQLFQAKVALSHEPGKSGCDHKTLLFIVFDIEKDVASAAWKIRREICEIWTGCTKGESLADYFELDLHAIRPGSNSELDKVRGHLMSNTMLDASTGKVSLDQWTTFARDCWNVITDDTSAPPKYGQSIV